jgi:hypothetical protein
LREWFESHQPWQFWSCTTFRFMRAFILSKTHGREIFFSSNRICTRFCRYLQLITSIFSIEKGQSKKQKSRLHGITNFYSIYFYDSGIHMPYHENRKICGFKNLSLLFRTKPWPGFGPGTFALPRQRSTRLSYQGMLKTRHTTNLGF